MNTSTYNIRYLVLVYSVNDALLIVCDLCGFQSCGLWLYSLCCCCVPETPGKKQRTWYSRYLVQNYRLALRV